jgi:YD repeat-containing protein
VLPANCADPERELTQLGLPKQAVQAILDAARAAQSESDAERYETLSFSYNLLGGVRYQWSEGRATHAVRDTDGRALRVTDPLGTTVTTRYSSLGFPVGVDAADASGQPVLELRRGYDENGAPVSECAARIAGECTSTPVAGSVRTWKYWPEEAVRESVDPEGLVSLFDYDERGLLKSKGQANPAFPADPRMETTYRYDTDGNRIGITYAPGQPVELNESFAYDGLQRLTTHTDTRNYAWQTAFTSRDGVARIKRADQPYAVNNPNRSSWEAVFTYDNFGDLARGEDNGIQTVRLRRTPGGRIVSQAGAGIGETFITFDGAGRPAWTRDPSGTDTIFTRRTAGNKKPSPRSVDPPTGCSVHQRSWSSTRGSSRSIRSSMAAAMKGLRIGLATDSAAY